MRIAALRLPERAWAPPLGHEEEHDEEAVVDASLLVERAAPRADELVLQHPHRRDGEVERHHQNHPCTGAAARTSALG